MPKMEMRDKIAEVEKERDLARVNRDIGYKALKEVSERNTEARRAIQFTLVALHEGKVTPALSMAEATKGTALAEIVSGIVRDRNEARAEVEFLRGVGCNELDGTDVRGPCGACLKCARHERDEAHRQIEDAIEAMAQRGEKRNCGNKPKSLLEMVGTVMHNFLNAKAALNDYKVVFVRVTQERDEARAALADAYRRGAEGMRDQVASLFDGGQNVPGLMKSPEFRDFIRALPIPEDK